MLLAILATSYLADTAYGHGHEHGHAHDHDHHGHAHDHHGHAHDEPAHFKYTKKANQKQPEQQHGHAHDHNDNHGHAHDHIHEPEAQTLKQEPPTIIKRDKLTNVLHACLSTLLISLAPFVILFFIIFLFLFNFFHYREKISIYY